MLALRIALLGFVSWMVPAVLAAQTLDTARLKTGQDVVVRSADGEAARGRIVDASRHH